MKLKNFRAALDAAIAKLEATNPNIGEFEVVSWARDGRSITPCNIDGLLRDPQQLIELIDAQSNLVRNLPEGYAQPHVVSIEL